MPRYILKYHLYSISKREYIYYKLLLFYKKKNSKGVKRIIVSNYWIVGLLSSWHCKGECGIKLMYRKIERQKAFFIYCLYPPLNLHWGLRETFLIKQLVRQNKKKITRASHSWKYHKKSYLTRENQMNIIFNTKTIEYILYQLLAWKQHKLAHQIKASKLSSKQFIQTSYHCDSILNSQGRH